MIYILNYLAFFAGLGLLFLATGHGLAAPWSRRLGARPPVPLPVLKVALGAVLWMVLLFALAALGLLSFAPMLVVALLCSALGLGIAIRGGASSPSTWPWSRGLGRPAPGSVSVRVSRGLLVAGLVAVVTTLFLQSLRPNVSWDANVYHLTVPRLYLEAGGFRRIPFNVYSNWPLNLELLFALAMVAKDHVLAKLVHFGFGLLTLWTLVHVARLHIGRTAALLAVALVLANPVVLYEMRIAYVDLAFAFFFLLAFLFVGRAMDDAGSRTLSLLLAGISCGALTGLKLNGFFGLVSVLALYLVGWWRSGRDRPPLGKPLVCLILPSVLLSLPWVLKTLILTGNPAYPFFFPLWGGPEWSAELSSSHGEWQRSIGMGRGALDYLLLPLRVVLFGGHGYANFDGQIHRLWILVLPLTLVMVLAGRASSLSRRCLGVAGVYFVLWAASSQQMRFLIPILPLLAIAGVTSLVELLKLLPGSRWQSWGEACALLLALLVVLHSNAIYLRQNLPLIRDMTRHGEAIHQLVVHPVYHYINQRLPRDAKILFLNTNHGFFCQREFIADSFFEASQIAALLRDCETPGEVQARLEELGVTHILVENRELGIAYPAPFRQLLEDGERALLRYASPDNRFVILELDSKR